MYQMGKPVERRRRKAIGSKTFKGHDRQAAYTVSSLAPLAGYDRGAYVLMIA
jgi:hypothetical protein